MSRIRPISIVGPAVAGFLLSFGGAHADMYACPSETSEPLWCGDVYQYEAGSYAISMKYLGLDPQQRRSFQTTVNGKNTGIAYYTKDGALVDDGRSRYEPSNGVPLLQLQPGQQISAKYDQINKDGVYRVSRDCNVGKPESRSIGGRTFRAIRIDCTLSSLTPSGNEDTGSTYVYTDQDTGMILESTMTWKRGRGGSMSLTGVEQAPR